MRTLSSTLPNPAPVDWRRPSAFSGRLPLFLAVTFVIAALPLATAHATRIEEICDVRGVRENQLVGYGLVVGLRGTGDSGQARFTVQSTAAMLRRLGATVDPRQIQTKNAAAVIVTATLPAFSHPGSRIDITVSSLGNARSLQGGTLIQTPLMGANREVYAVAQGPLLIGGFSASGGTGSSVSQNHVTVGRIPEGAIVEQQVETPRLGEHGLVLTLRTPSFTTARRVVVAIEEAFGAGAASAPDPATVRVRIPAAYRGDPVRLLAEVQALEVDAASPTRVVIDERTGTVVLGGNVRIAEVAIAQGGLTIEVSESFAVSQPQSFGQGETAVVPESEVEATVRSGSLHHVQSTASLADVVSALNALGATPRDLMSIFQALKTAGALHAEILVE